MNQLPSYDDPLGLTHNSSFKPYSIQRQSLPAIPPPSGTGALAVTPYSYSLSQQIAIPFPKKDLKRLADSLDIVGSIPKMADPLSIIASMIAVSEAGMKISKSLYYFASALRSSVDDIERLAFEIDTFSSVLDDLRSWLQDNRQVISQSALDTANKLLRRCKKTFADIKKMIGTGADENYDPPRFWSRMRFVFQYHRIEPLRASLESCKSTLALQLSTFKLAEFTRALDLAESSKPRLLEEKKLRTRVEHNVVTTQHSLIRWQQAEINIQYMSQPLAPRTSQDSNWLLGLVPSLKLPSVPHIHYPMLLGPEAENEKAREKRRLKRTVNTLLSSWTNQDEVGGHPRTSNERREVEHRPSMYPDALAVKDNSTKKGGVLSQKSSQKQLLEKAKSNMVLNEEAGDLTANSPNKQKRGSSSDQGIAMPEPDGTPWTVSLSDDEKLKKAANNEDQNELKEPKRRQDIDKTGHDIENNDALSTSSDAASPDLPMDRVQAGFAEANDTYPITQSAEEANIAASPNSHFRAPDSYKVELEDAVSVEISPSRQDRHISTQESRKSKKSPDDDMVYPSDSLRSSKSSTTGQVRDPSKARHTRPNHGPNKQAHPISNTPNNQKYPSSYAPHPQQRSHEMMPYGPIGYPPPQNHISSVSPGPIAPWGYGDDRFAPNAPHAYPYNQATYMASGGIPYTNGIMPGSNAPRPHALQQYRFPAPYLSPSPISSTASLSDSDEDMPNVRQSTKADNKANSMQEDVLLRLEAAFKADRRDHIEKIEEIEKRMQRNVKSLAEAQYATELAQRLHLENQSSKAVIDDTKGRSKQDSLVRLISADGKSFLFPYTKCRTWTEMKELLQTAHRQNHPELDLSDFDSFLLVEDDGNFVHPELWEDTVKPNSTLTLKLMLSDEDTKRDVPSEEDERENAMEESCPLISSSIHTADPSSSHIYNRAVQTRQASHKIRSTKRGMRVKVSPPVQPRVPTPPPAIQDFPRNHSPSSSSSDAKEENNFSGEELSEETSAISEADTAARQPVALELDDLYKDLSDHLQLVMAAESSLARVRATRKVSSILQQESAAEGQQHQLHASNTIGKTSTSPHMEGNISNGHGIHWRQRQNSHFSRGDRRDHASSQQTNSSHTRPKHPTNRLSYSERLPTHQSLRDRVPTMQSTITDPTSIQLATMSESHNASAGQKLDYITTLLTRREQEDQARELAAKHAADEGRLKAIEGKLHQLEGASKYQDPQHSSSLSPPTINDKSTGKDAENEVTKPRIDVASGSNSSHSFSRRFFRRKSLGRPTPAPIVTS